MHLSVSHSFFLLTNLFLLQFWKALSLDTNFNEEVSGIETDSTNARPATCDDSSSCTRREDYPDYLVVGAGGSGIQAALLLQKYNLSHVVLEKGSTAGTFWTKFPVFGELISINKHVRNETQRLKYDWHSFLESPVKMWNITRKYFPAGSEWHEYMMAVVETAKINVEYGVEVESVAGDGSPCVHLVDGTKRCAKHRVLVGTGLQEKEEPMLQALGGIPYSRITKDMAIERNVCIFGNGNAGFEIAQNVYDVAERVILYGKQPARLSAVTRYTGDVRAKFYQVLENFHGKLLDTVYQFDVPLLAKQPHPEVARLLQQFNQTQLESFHQGLEALGHISRFNCEVFALATGFKSNVPGLNLEARFPSSDDWFTAKHNPNVHYIGWLMHERDFRKGAGGFLSGFRYLIHTLVHHIREVDHGISYPRVSNISKEGVIKHVFHRAQIADDLIVLQDGVILRDAIVKDKSTGLYSYYEGIPYQFFPMFNGRRDIIFFYFAWGNGRTASNVFDSVLRYDDGKLINLFLHPVIEVNGMVRDLHEDLLMEWNSASYERAFRIAVQSALDNKLNLFREKPDFPYKRAVIPSSEGQNHFETSNHHQQLDGDLGRLLLEASQQMLDEASVARLRTRLAEVFPNLLQL